MNDTTVAIRLLMDSLEHERDHYRDLRACIERAAKNIKDAEAEMSKRSARMTDIERAIVTLGGQVPPAENAPARPEGMCRSPFPMENMVVNAASRQAAAASAGY